MNIGELRHRVTVQGKAITQDTYGAPVESWADVATVWAAVEPLHGREFFAAQQVNAEVTTRIRIRFRSGVTPNMRVLWNGNTYNIQSVIDVGGRHVELHLMCSEVI